MAWTEMTDSDLVRHRMIFVASVVLLGCATLLGLILGGMHLQTERRALPNAMTPEKCKDMCAGLGVKSLEDSVCSCNPPPPKQFTNCICQPY